MTLLVRNMRDGDAQAFLAVHHTAVRALAAHDYAPEVIEAWAPLPITPAAVAGVVANREHETRFVAERDGKLVGIASLVVANSELRACYVAPEAARTGVGTALIVQLEQAARHAGLHYLQADASLTAERFYRSLGYDVVAYGQHFLRHHLAMPCVKIRKVL